VCDRARTHVSALTRAQQRFQRKLACDQQSFPFLIDRRSGFVRGRGAPVLVCACLSPRVSRFLSFLCQRHGGADVDGASWNNGQDDAGVDERFVEPKLLEWLRSGVAP
jgi:hypothetical protein